MPKPLLSFLFILLIQSLLLTGCGGSAGSSANQQSAPPPPPAAKAPSIQVSASPNSIALGAFSTITWSAANATSIAFQPSLEQEDQALPMSGSMAVAPQQTTTYIATATGPGGSANQSVTITVALPQPSLTLVAQPGTISAGGSSTLSWNAENTSALSIDGIGPVALPSGSLVVSPAATTNYTARATGAGGTTVQTATVTVSSVSFSTSAQAIAPGQSVTLSWNAPGASAVAIDNGIGNVAAPSGSISVSPSATTRYTLNANESGGGQLTASTLVVVSQAGAGFTNIKHIIFFVQENRSFDNYFGQMGAYRAARGFTDPFDGLPPNAVQMDAAGTPIPSFHLQTMCVENTDPGWGWVWPEYDNGKMDQFVVQAGLQTQKKYPNSPDPDGTRAMGYYDQTDLPYYYELAFQFATSDRFFTSMMSGTVPNRMYLFAGSSFGYIYAPATTTVGGLTEPTIFDKMDQAGVSWRYYFQDNSVFLAQWSTWFRDSGKVWNISNWYNDIQNEATLPQVIFIERASHLELDEHPGGPNIQKGAANTKQILDALMQSPAWGSSVFILTYDEPGGLYDHVPPVALPAPDNIPPMGSSYGDFKHSGFRIPVTVVSPWIKSHFVSHTNRDLTSILKLIETRFGVENLTARDAGADDMTEFLDFSQPQLLTPPALPDQPVTQPCDFNLEKAPGH